MISDTKAYHTIVTEDILPAEFREYLKTSIHNPYHSEDGLRLLALGASQQIHCTESYSAVLKQHGQHYYSQNGI